MQQLINVQTVIKSAVLIPTMGAIGIPHAWPIRRREREDEERLEGRNGVMDKRARDGYGRI